MLSEKEFNKIFAKNLVANMNAYKMKQKDLADILGVSTSTINSWVHAQRTPRMDKVDALCGIFYCNRSDLIAEDTTVYKSETDSLIRMFKSLNEEGQQAVLDYVDYISSKPEYKKHSESDMVQDA